MGLKFLQDIANLDNIQFVNGSGTNAGLINMDGDDLVISNAIGGVFLGTGTDDIYIGDGTSSVDIRFEQNMSIFADSSTTKTLTLGGANTSLVLDSPSFSGTVTLGATSINNKLTFTTANGYILFDYEPAGDTGEYTTEVPLLKVDHNGTEKTILSRISENGGIQLGHDDSVLITAGDVGDEIKANWGATNENVVLASEAGFYALAFPNNSTTWSNRNIFRFYGGSGTASENGLYIGDGSSTQFIDLDRNISAASVTAGNIKAMGGGNLFVYDDDDSTKIHFFASSNATEGFLQLSNGSNWGLLARGIGNSPRLGAYHNGDLRIYGFGSNTGADHADDDELARFDFANERFDVNGEIRGDSLDIDGNADISGNIVVSGTVDGRDIATDGTKLDTIATNADVTPSWVPSSDPSYLTAHPNISAASSVNNSGKTHIQDITVDSNGHVTGIVSHALTSSDFVEPNSNATLNSLSCGTFTHPTDISFVLDNDNNETASFIIKDGAGNSPFTLTEAGDLTITGKFVSTFASKASSGAVLVEDSGEIKKRTTTELKTDLSLNNVPNTDATNASNLASGTVPTARLATTAIAKGGTGATTASGARAALGVDAAGTDNSTDVTLAGSLNYITISGQEITRNAIDLAADVTGTLPQTNLPDDMDSDKVKQICVTNHGFALDSNTSAPNYFPLNNLNETRAGDTAQYYARMIAPYAGRVIKVMVRADADIGNSCSVVLTKLSTSGQNPDGLRDEGTDVETVSSVDCSAINTTHTFTFSSGTFGSGDVVNIGLQKNSSNTANVTAVVVWEYTL